MSIDLILSLLDEEISRLKEARNILAGHVELPLEEAPPAPRIKRSAPPPRAPEPQVTVVPPRVRRSRSVRSNPAADTTSALHANVPTGVVAVSASEAAKKRERVAPVVEPAPLRWTTAGAKKVPTIDDLFGKAEEKVIEASAAFAPADPPISPPR